MGNKIYVGNLAFSVTDDSLNQLFSQHGTVQSAKVVMDRDSGRSRGFGFVEMGTDAEAAEAISKLNGTDFEGRTLRVSEARPKENKGGGRGGRGGFAGGGGRGGGRGQRW